MRKSAALLLIWSLFACAPASLRPDGAISSDDAFIRPDAEIAGDAPIVEDVFTPDVSNEDATPEDTGGEDAINEDATAEDAVAEDAPIITFDDAMPDTGAEDALPEDAPAPDVPAPDAELDAGFAEDALPIDTGVAPDAGFNPDATPADVPLGAPIVAAPNTWTWVDFPNTFCDEGTPTGLGVNTSTLSSNVLVFFNGGGACWDYDTCFVLNTSAHGPFTQGEFATLTTALNSGIFDRTAATNVFRNWSFVFIPYCTGDLHAGNNVAIYPAPSGPPGTIRHVGRANVLAYLERLGATFTNPAVLAVTGASAGGFGALFNYEAFRTYWPNATGILIDDSGPPLPGNGIPQVMRDAWFASWRMDLLVDPICGLGCRSDLSLFPLALAARHPNDRMSLLSSVQDAVIRSFIQQSAAAFEAEVVQLAQLLDTNTPNFKYFYVPGASHTMLGDPPSYNSNNTNLTIWMQRQVTGDPAWASTRP